MRKLEDQTGVQAPSADYPKGRVQDNQTLWQETIVGDIIQFFQKLVGLASITENTLPDNETNDYQLLEALSLFTRELPYRFISDSDATILFNERLIKFTDTSGDSYILTLNDGEFDGDTKIIIYDVPSSGQLTIRDADLSTIFDLYGAESGVIMFRYNLTDDEWKLISASQATDVYPGQVELATSTETQALSDSKKAVTPAGLSSVTGGLLIKVVDIGDWNMDSTEMVSIAHGLTATDIRIVQAYIRADSGVGIDQGSTGFSSSFFSLDIMHVASGAPAGTILGYNSTNVGLFRYPSRLFDSTNFDATSYNRGWIVIWYVP